MLSAVSVSLFRTRILWSPNYKPHNISLPRDVLVFANKLSVYRGADKSLARPTSRYILFDGENSSFDASLVICINSTNIPPIMI